MSTHTTDVARTVLAAIVFMGAGVHAQNSNSAREEQPSITVTGCLQPAGADRTTVGTSGSTASADTGASRTGSTAGDSRSFMLVNARVGAAPGGGSGVTTVAPAGSGTTESAVRAGNTAPSPAIIGATDDNGNSTNPGAMYALRGDNPELPRHVGQEVQISGKLIAVGDASTTSGAQAPGSTASTTSTAASSTAAGSIPQLEVGTIRMIASVCAAR